MRIPSIIKRSKSNTYKNHFGHVLILAGSRQMLGAAALSGLSSLRSGAGLVTIGIPKSLNAIIQKKISNEIMTWPLPETSTQSFNVSASELVLSKTKNYQAIAIGPGLSQNTTTQRFALKIIEKCPLPLVIDADALNALAGNLHILEKAKGPRILTPHPGEMARLAAQSKKSIESNRSKITKDFSHKYNCTLLLKGHRTIVSTPNKLLYTNKSGNAGMATAGSGDVLTGMIAAFLAQGLSIHDAAKFGAYLHGKAGDFAGKSKGKTSMIASDIIENIPKAFKSNT